MSTSVHRATLKQTNKKFKSRDGPGRRAAKKAAGASPTGSGALPCFS